MWTFNEHQLTDYKAQMIINKVINANPRHSQVIPRRHRGDRGGYGGIGICKQVSFKLFFCRRQLVLCCVHYQGVHSRSGDHLKQSHDQNVKQYTDDLVQTSCTQIQYVAWQCPLHLAFVCYPGK